MTGLDNMKIDGLYKTIIIATSQTICQIKKCYQTRISPNHVYGYMGYRGYRGIKGLSKYKEIPNIPIGIYKTYAGYEDIWFDGLILFWFEINKCVWFFYFE